jgi:hypothetical protein
VRVNSTTLLNNSASHRIPKQLKANLRTAFYGGEGHASDVHELLDIAGYWAHAKEAKSVRGLRRITISRQMSPVAT